MSLLTQASLILTPNATKASKLYSIIPSNGNGDMTVVRATTATRVNSLGLIENVASNVARLNYEGGRPSILLEPQRTNLITYSEQFDNVTWTKADATVTQNSQTSPDGAVTADTFIANGLPAFHAIQISSQWTISIVYTISVYVKKNTNNFIQLIAPNLSFGLNAYANFNVDAGVLETVGSSCTATISNVGNGWFRCSLTATATSTSTSGISFCLITSQTSARAENNTLSTSVYIWGAQLEQGAYATSYIPTVASTVTRNADVTTRNNIYTNGYITSAGGTWVVELNNNFSLTRDAVGGGIWIGDNNSSSTSGNSLNIRHNGFTSRLIINKNIAGVLTPLYVTLTDTVKLAINWNGTTADLFVNGIKVITGTSFTTTNMEFLNSSTSDVPRYIKSMMLFPKPLTDAEMMLLTSFNFTSYTEMALNLNYIIQ